MVAFFRDFSENTFVVLFAFGILVKPIATTVANIKNGILTVAKRLMDMKIEANCSH